jgi:hypothetical protein
MIIPLNIYEDIFVLRFLIPSLAYDEPGNIVFCSEGADFEGTSLTFKQSRSGYNLQSKEGILAFLSKLEVTPAVFRFASRYESPDLLGMWKSLPLIRALGRLPGDGDDQDSFLADLMLLPCLDRLNAVMDLPPDVLLRRLLRLIHSFLSTPSLGSYKDRYRTKLLALDSKFRPSRREFGKLDLSPESYEDTSMLLTMMFGI